MRGEDRRKNVAEALALVEDQILPVLRQKKYVVVKPNVVSLIQPLAATHADALNGILDFLAPRFKGPVVIAESSAANTFAGYEQFGYTKVPAEHKDREVQPRRPQRRGPVRDAADPRRPPAPAAGAARRRACSTPTPTSSAPPP